MHQLFQQRQHKECHLKSPFQLRGAFILLLLEPKNIDNYIPFWGGGGQEGEFDV